MADPDRDTQPTDRTDADRIYYEFAASAFVTLFWRQPLLEEAIGRFRDQDYAVVVVDASRWSTTDDFHRDIAAALDFPAYYGENLDAFNDCMRDVVSRDYGFPETASGFVLVFTHYDRFAGACPKPAQIVLDIVADRARNAAVYGTHVLCLVHSDDSDIVFGPVGATPVMWNRAEWLDSHRRG